MVQGMPRSSPRSALTHCQAFAACGTQEATPFMNALSLSYPHTCCKHCYVMAPFSKALTANTCCSQPCKAASSFLARIFFRTTVHMKL